MSRHFPFINPFTVDELTIDWWALYVAHTKAIEKAAAERRQTAGARRQR